MGKISSIDHEWLEMAASILTASSPCVPIYDPYDLWITPWGVNIKKKYYQSRLIGRGAAVAMGGLDWLVPNFSRSLFQCEPRCYPIVSAQEIMRMSQRNLITCQNAPVLLHHLKSLAVDPSGAGGWAWGLGFPWMSKNGFYAPSIPFITHTPYVMEALLVLSMNEETKMEALEIFRSTWNFLENLIVRYKGSQGLALSYAPIDEPRTVVNANGYAAYAYALHACYGDSTLREQAEVKASQLTQWIISQQQKNGSWLYYADEKKGNFIDCFHSCFVLKNLLKTSKLLPDMAEPVHAGIKNGWRYLHHNFYDKSAGLCRRFTKQDIYSPFLWDLYDQAEYLGLLVDLKKYDQATLFYKRVHKKFQKNKNWYCKIDWLGRLWGKDFFRWGITSFLYNIERLEQVEFK